MDTKLKKSSKLAKLIIFLTVLLPAVFLVGLYPRMEKLMLEKQEAYKNQIMDNTMIENTGSAATEKAGYSNISIRSDMVNYAVEASYYLYGRMLQEAKGTEVAFDVLDNHGWINDFYTINVETLYFAEYSTEEGNYTQCNTEVLSLDNLRGLLNNTSVLQGSMNQLAEEYDIIGGLVIEFDAYGMISNIEFVGADGVEYTDNLYARARNSVNQYQANANYYLDSEADVPIDVMEVLPKNFKVIFLIPEYSEFVDSFIIELSSFSYYNSPERLYVEIGAPIAVIVFAIIVALVALILPFFKKLNTGWEKLFSLPFEVICCLFVAVCCGVWLMFEAMCYSTYYEISQNIGSIEILGYVFESNVIYAWVLVLNGLGWLSCFFLEYIIVAHCRQFLCGPIYYFKHRILVIRFLRWIGRQFKKLYHYIVGVDINRGLHGNIILIVLANFVIVSILCCLWISGIVGVIIYSVLLYVVLRQQGKKLQEQYGSILHATKQMADGELKITLNEDLGVFASLGAELEKVQEGFSKAVAEEAKSQNMKTELISNVSHDLKTPLTAIITYVNLLKQEGISEADRKSYINTLDMKSQRLKVLIEDLFEVSKAQSGNIQLNYMDVDVVNIMKQLRLEMEDKLADSDLVFRWNLPEEKVILKLDGQKTYRIFENLLSNALKYAMPNSRVYVDIINEETRVEIIFKNISAAEINTEAERLTERFVRGDASRTSEGSGLGLAIVNSFVDIQGGSFKIDVDGDLFKAIIVWKK